MQTRLYTYQNRGNFYVSSTKSVSYSCISLELANLPIPIGVSNVLSVISDKVIPHVTGSTIAYYKADILQAQDYSPFGVTLKGRNLKKTGLADEFRFGFQDQEMDDELTGEGNSVSYTFRMHDPRLGRFFAIDPASNIFPWNSSYAFSENKVINCIEMEGLEAWEVNKEWNETYIKGYGEYVKEYAKECLAKDVNRTCEDFALGALFRYSVANNLPLTITNGSGSYNVEDWKKGDYAGFAEKVMTSTAANDLVQNTTGLDVRTDKAKDGLNDTDPTKSTALDQIKESIHGDIVLHDKDHDGTYTHIQVVSGTESGGDKIIRQGNLNMRVLSGNPNSLVYAGEELERGVWIMPWGNFTNYTTGASYDNATVELGIQVRAWDFEKFNSNSKSLKIKTENE